MIDCLGACYPSLVSTSSWVPSTRARRGTAIKPLSATHVPKGLFSITEQRAHKQEWQPRAPSCNPPPTSWIWSQVGLTADVSKCGHLEMAWMRWLDEPCWGVRHIETWFQTMSLSWTLFPCVHSFRHNTWPSKISCGCKEENCCGSNPEWSWASMTGQNPLPIV